MIDEILRAILDAGGRPLYVGGCVRDSLLDKEPKDWDVEVYRLSPEHLLSILNQFGHPTKAGASFGVFKMHLPEGEFDFSVPRLDSRMGIKHTDFMVAFDPTLTPAQAAYRRDFTMNSVALDPFTGEILDPYDGLQDLRNGILRHTSDSFAEDALRVLRGMQFCARFKLVAVQDTVDLCNSLYSDYAGLSADRIWGEWEKWARQGEVPSCGLDFLSQTNWIQHYPALSVLDGIGQDWEWHPEGSVYAHTCYVVDAMANICQREGISGQDRVVLIFAALLHDVGKAVTTASYDDGHVRSPGHEQAGGPIAREFLEQIGAPLDVIGRVIPLIENHMAHLAQHSTRTTRRLALRLQPANIEELCWVIEADHSGRPPLPIGMPEQALAMLQIAQAEQIEAAAPAPIVMGRHLIEMGFKPGPGMGYILREAFEAQLNAEFNDLESGVAWVNRLFVPDKE